MQGRIPGPLPEGLTVIETMRRDADGRIRLWPLHLQRLRRDCVAVGFPLDEKQVLDRLSRLPAGKALRLRLSVAGDGAVELVHQPLPAHPPEWRVDISGVRIDSGDAWVRIKTSNRPIYDRARAAMPDGIDETILLNERGEVCEGTITNLFLCRDGRLLTPPLACGLLPGVLRAALIEEGRALEAMLTPDDLMEGPLLMGNALRGLIPARLVTPCSGGLQDRLVRSAC
ncbi:aminotransferase class IV family protein [Paracoccus benzoatiresistens]|uniref:Probable branched-chain-amino-acid aminotransferase n=1 Tax=Paracoccus benzoatiresistens TaxID=2997341 RepID=A0ABT4J197_9RHOB|nr:aminotransferase class IV family protein [Paracoccus sp. EF6]MCZ0960884.1 aminotransferase class IV family protein [Paracoccus sp. EF6]